MKPIFHTGIVLLLAVVCGLFMPVFAQQTELVSALQLQTLEQNAMLSSGTFSRFGNYFAVFSRNNQVRMYGEDLSLIWSYRGRGDHGTAPGLAMSGDERWTVFPGYGAPNAIAVVSTADGQLITRLTGHTDEVRALVLTPDDRYLISFAPGELFLWKRNNPGEEPGFTLVQEIPTGDLRISNVAVSPDSRTLAIGNTQDVIDLYDIDAQNDELVRGETLRPNQQASNTGYVNGLAYSPDGQWLAVGVRDELTVYRVQDGEYETWQVVSDIDEGYVYSIRFAPDSGTLFTGFGGSDISIWTLERGQRVVPAAGKGQTSVSSDDVELWQYQSTFADGQGYIADIDVRGDGKMLASMSITENGAVLWQIDGTGTGDLSRLDSLLRQLNGDNSPGSAQAAVLFPAFASSILNEIGDQALAERDMFETRDAYERRINQAAGLAANLVEQRVLEYFGARRDGDRVLFPAQARGSYDIDNELYYLPVAGSIGTISIAAENARALYNRWNESSILVSGDMNHNWNVEIAGIDGSFPLLFDQDPLSGYTSQTRDFQIGDINITDFLTLSQVNVGTVFPALYRSYENLPLIETRLTNLYDYPIEQLRITSRSGDGGLPLEVVRSVTISGGQSLEVQVPVLFESGLLRDDAPEILPIILDISYRLDGSDHQSSIRIPARRQTRNAMRWDDDRKIAAMVNAASSPIIMESAGNIISSVDIADAAGITENMRVAMGVFSSMKFAGLVYRPDPATPYEQFSQDGTVIDYVQFPEETITYGSGDCDDLSVLFASLLEAAGISTAFITVPGHIFTAFDSGLSPGESASLFSRPDLTIELDGRVWIPLETTLLNASFDQARQEAAQMWRRYDSRGEAAFILTPEAWQVYPPAGYQSETSRSILQSAPSAQLSTLFENYRHDTRDGLVDSGNLADPQNQRQFNRRGIIHARFGFYDDAEQDFLTALTFSEYVPALVNLSKIEQLRGNQRQSNDYLSRARQVRPENADVLLALAVQQLREGDISRARELWEQVMAIDEQLARTNPLFAVSTNTAGETTNQSGLRASSAESALDRYMTGQWSE